MEEWPPTQTSLLRRVRDRSDSEAWNRFVEIYAPAVYGYARRQGLQDADAADLAQDVFRSVAEAMAGFRYNPERGSFRGWLFTIARNKLRTFRAATARREQASGKSGTLRLLSAVAAPDEDGSREWDEEYDRQLFAWAARRVRKYFSGATWQAFWQNGVEGRSASVVARGLGLSVGAVYVAKCRVLARLREEVRQIEERDRD